jgi:hypothetical protein
MNTIVAKALMREAAKAETDVHCLPFLHALVRLRGQCGFFLKTN